MATFKKGMLEAGVTYHSPDGQLPVTTERLRHWRDTFHKFKELGLKVPVFWGHQDDAKKAVPRKRLPKDAAGKLVDMVLTDNDTKAEFTIDVPRKEDASKVENNLVSLSPVVFKEWEDGDGTIHKDCINDVDLVVHEVDHRQTDFEPVLACSTIRMGLETGNPVIYRLAEHEDMADDESTHDSDAQDTGTDRLKNVIEALAGMQIVLPEDTTAENFFERVESALLTAAAMGGGGDMSTDTQDLEEARPEFAALSLENKRWRAHADSEHREKVATRLNLCLEKGQCTPAEQNQKEAEIKTVRLSLDNDGKHQPTRVESWLESREAIPHGTFWDSQTRTRMSKLDVVPHPPATTGDQVTDEEADEIVAEINRRK